MWQYYLVVSFLSQCLLQLCVHSTTESHMIVLKIVIVIEKKTHTKVRTQLFGSDKFAENRKLNLQNGFAFGSKRKINLCHWG